MTFGTAQRGRSGEAWAAITALIETEGSASEHYPAQLIAPGAPSRDLADAVHCFCMLHGRHPGIIERAEERAGSSVAAAWLAEAAAAFADERATLVKLVGLVGPLPSTPGQSESEAAIAGQRHALDMLSGSDRAGCPIGAALALLLDWPVLRGVLDAIAARMGVDVPASTLTTQRDSATVIATLAESVAFDRAMLFGAQQMLAQHRALWQLLESRSVARGHG